MVQHDFPSPVLPVEERELVRQLHISRLLMEEMGGSLPCEQIMTKHLSAVLDVACGTGGWTLDVAQSYPLLHVTGIDTSEPHVVFAQRLAEERGWSMRVLLLSQVAEEIRQEDFCGLCFLLTLYGYKEA